MRESFRKLARVVIDGAEWTLHPPMEAPSVVARSRSRRTIGPDVTDRSKEAGRIAVEENHGYPLPLYDRGFGVDVCAGPNQNAKFLMQNTA